MDGFVVKPACEAEIDDVKRLYDDVIEVNSGSKYDVLWRRDLHPSDESIEAAVVQGELVAAYLDGQMIGACVLDHEFACGYDKVPWRVQASLDKVMCLHLFCLHPEVQGRGLASKYLSALADWARAQGMSAIRLDVFYYNEPAKYLYEKMGYGHIERVLLTYEDQEVSTIPFDMYELAL